MKIQLKQNAQIKVQETSQLNFHFRNCFNRFQLILKFEGKETRFDIHISHPKKIKRKQQTGRIISHRFHSKALIKVYNNKNRFQLFNLYKKKVIIKHYNFKHISLCTDMYLVYFPLAGLFSIRNNAKKNENAEHKIHWNSLNYASFFALL